MATKKRGLGQGLSALINDDGLEDKIMAKDIMKVNINLIEPNPNQPRKSFDDNAIHELADSIKSFGVLQPLVVVKNDKFYEIIAGERRWRAAKIAGLKDIPVIVKEFTHEEMVEVALIENIQREDLNPIEEAIAYQRLIEEFHLKQEEVAEKVSKSRSAITNTLRLLVLDDRVQKMVIDEMISSGHARTLISIQDKNEQYEIALRIFDRKLSVRETENLIKKLSATKKQGTKKETSSDPIFQAMQKNIEEKLGTKVKINAKKNKGKIEIEYFSNAELGNIIGASRETVTRQIKKLEKQGKLKVSKEKIIYIDHEQF